MALHNKHGNVVRIAPNSISINDPAAVSQIYSHRSNFVKGDFYDAFLQVKPVVFNVRDIPSHQRKRKYLNPAFSTRALSDFESSMDNDVRLWKQQLLKMTEETHVTSLDFAIWSSYPSQSTWQDARC